MKRQISILLCNILEYLGALVAINLEIEGKVKPRTDYCYWYSNDLTDATVIDFNGDKLEIPNGKFNIEINKK